MQNAKDAEYEQLRKENEDMKRAMGIKAEDDQISKRLQAAANQAKNELVDNIVLDKMNQARQYSLQNQNSDGNRGTPGRADRLGLESPIRSDTKPLSAYPAHQQEMFR